MTLRKDLPAGCKVDMISLKADVPGIASAEIHINKLRHHPKTSPIRQW
jgi:hypothetical protein